MGVTEVTQAAFHSFLKHTSDMVFVKDINLIYAAVSDSFAAMSGNTSALDVVGKDDFEVFSNPELAKRYTDDDRKLLSENKDLVNYVEPLTDDRGHPRYSSTSKFILRDRQGQAIGILGISRDITRDYMTQLRHQQELKFLFELPQDTYAALFMDIDEWRIIRHHRRIDGQYILSLQESMEHFINNAVNCCLIDPEQNVEVLRFYRGLSRESMLQLCDSGKRSFTLEYLRRMPQADPRWVQVDIHFLTDPENGHRCAIWSLRDIDNLHQEAAKLQHAAQRDEMTGLLNRATTMKQIQHTLDECTGETHALFVLDVDNFKSLNDTLGHQAGDMFLVALSNTLKKCFRESDVLGRIGGDEFFVLMKSPPNISTVKEKAETLLEASQRICAAYPGLSLSISIGISMFPANGATLETLYNRADEALYQVKKQGKNQFVFASKTASKL